MYEKELKFSIPHGHMTIAMDEFFPASDARIRKLFRIMRQDWDNDVPGLTKEIKRFILSKKIELAEKKKFSGVKFFEWHQKKCDLERMVETGKQPSGVLIRKSDMQTLKKKYREAKGYESAYRKDAEGCERTIVRLEKNLELINRLEE